MTPHRYITGIITERGIFKPPFAESLKRAFEVVAVDAVERADPRDRDVVRRDRRRRHRPHQRSRPALDHPLEHRRVADRHPPRVGRRGAGARVPAARPRHLRRGRSGARQARRHERGFVRAVAVTQGPGLVGSLLVGVAFAKAFAWARGLPVVPVHHLAGHIESLVLAHGELPLPAAVLVVSGGHTSLYFIPDARPLPAGRPDARRRGGGGVRQGREAAGPGISGRAGDRRARPCGQRSRVSTFRSPG